MKKQCPCCFAPEISPFYTAQKVPTHSVLLLTTKEEALSYPQDDIILAFCHKCGFIFNAAFSEKYSDYSAKYEGTQVFSNVFNAFHQKLASDLITKYQLYNKTIIEIGCGIGDFLYLLCAQNQNHGIGFDPAYEEQRHNFNSPYLQFIPDYYSPEYSSYKADFVCCKMTLEHIPEVGNFLQMLYQNFKESPETVFFFQIPNATYILQECAFWDIYYEHSSYFSPESLANAFCQNNFEVMEVNTQYDNQYLTIEAKPRDPKQNKPYPQMEIGEYVTKIQQFSQLVKDKIQKWQLLIQSNFQQGKKIVVWGGGSKGVTFLTTLEIFEEISYVVDINPHKEDTFMAGTGQKIVTPKFLESYQPDIVIIMNPIYKAEISDIMLKMQQNPLVLTLADNL